MSLLHVMHNRRKFLECSVLGAGGMIFSTLISSCTDHNIPGLEEVPPIISHPKTYTITNQLSGQLNPVPVIILIARGDDNAIPAPRYYEKDLTAVNISGISPHTLVCHPGETKQFTLQQDAEEFIIAKLDTLYPIAVVRPYNDQTQSIDPIIVTNEHYQNMNSAKNLSEMVKTYPDSDIAKGYQQLIAKLTDISLSQDDIQQALDDYCRSHVDLSFFPFENLAIMSTYQNRYPYPWTNYEPARMHYLYSSDGNSLTYKGAVEIVNIPDTSAVVNLQKMLISFTDEHNKSKPLHYVDGFFVDDINAESPDVCLVGNFVLASRLNNVPGDNRAIPTLMGAVSGITVMSTDQKPQETHSWFYLLTHPKTFKDYMDILLLIAGAMIGIEEFLVAGIFLIADEYNRDQSKSDGTLAAMIEKANKDRLAKSNNRQGKPIPLNVSLDDIPSFD